MTERQVSYTPSETNEVNPENKNLYLEKYFGISPSDLDLIKQISSTLVRCGKYTFMNYCHTYMTRFLKRMIREIITDVEKKHMSPLVHSLTASNKPRIEIIAYVYFHIIKYLEMECLLCNEVFGENTTQFCKVMTDSLSLVGLPLFAHSSTMDSWRRRSRRSRRC